MRYQFLAFVAENERADCIVTGHTADDQAETVLLRVIRGSGVRGVRGMLPAAPVPGASAHRLIRPLLVVRRDQTVAICAEAGIAPLSDPTNADIAHARNHVRHQLLPALRTLNPSVDRSLLGLAESARDVFSEIERQSFAAQPTARLPHGAIFELAVLGSLHNEALTLVLEREAAFFSLEPDVNRTRVHNLLTVLRSGSGRVRFGDTMVEVSCGRARVGPLLAPPHQFEPRILNVPGVTVAGSWRVEVATNPIERAPGAFCAAIEASRLRGALRVRPLRPGDRMLFRGIVRNVADILTNEKVPAWDRPGLVAVADASGVVAVIGALQPDVETAPPGDALFVRVTRRPA